MNGDLAFVCIQNGEKYSDDYVDRLVRGVRRNCSVEAPFLCLTDRPRSWREAVRPVLAKPGLPGWWQKISLFDPEVTEFRHLIFFDLDTVILRSIDRLFRFVGTQEFTHARDCIDPLSSSLMVIDTHGEFSRRVHEGFDPNLWLNRNTGDQQYLMEHLSSPSAIQSLEVEEHYSYKYFIGHEDWRERTVDPGYQPVSFDRLVTLNFHGYPKPEDLLAHPEQWQYSREIISAWTH